MDEFWGNGLQAVAVSVATVAVLALLRLVTPSVRWARRLKAETEVFSALPDGTERDLWAKRVEAQAERLRLYRENFSVGSQAVAWYACLALVGFIVGFVLEALNGWPNLRLLTVDDVPFVIITSLLLILNLGFAVIVTIRLVLGGATSMSVDGSGHYPKMVALAESEDERRLARIKAEKRSNVVRYHADKARKERKRAVRVARRTANRPQDPPTGH